MLLNYTPVIAELLLLVGIVGAIIGLLFFTVSDKYTLSAGPITTICISMSIMLIGIFIQEYKSRDANFSDMNKVPEHSTHSMGLQETMVTGMLLSRIHYR